MQWRWMKHAGCVGCIGLLSLTLTGCNSLQPNNIDTSDVKVTDTYVPADSLKELEILNICNDTDIFLELNDNQVQQLETLEKSGKSSENQTKMYMVMNDYVLGVYQLATSRLAADIETVYINSDEYMNYLAMLQVFADSYTEEKEEFQEKMANGDTSLMSLQSYQAFATVENYYIGIYENGYAGNTEKNQEVDSQKNEEENSGKNMESLQSSKHEDQSSKPSLDELISATQ